MPRRNRKGRFVRRTRTRRLSTMPRRKKRGRRRGGRRTGRSRTMTKPKPSISKLLAIGLPQAVALKSAWDASGGGADMKAFGQEYVNANIRAYTGYDPGARQFDLGNLAIGWGPIVAAKAVSMAKRTTGFRTPKSLPITI